MSYNVDDRMGMWNRERVALQRVASGDPTAKFWISWLEDQGYCEYKLCLKCRGEFAPDSDDSIAGVERHAEIQAAHDEVAEPVESVSEAVAQAVGFGCSSSISECYIQGVRLSGKVDEIQIAPDTVYVIDNKPRSGDGIPYHSQQRQALGYAVAWSQSYPYYYHAGKIVAVIRDRDTMEWLWEKILDDDAIRKIDEELDWIQQILQNPELARDTGYESKCRKCRYHSNRLCDRDKCGG